MTTQPQPLADLAGTTVLRPAAGGEPALLLGSRCRSCDTRAFPGRAVCFQCLGEDLEVLPLGPDGTLYSYSTVRVSASRPTPYTLGYVDLPEGPRVLAHLSGDPGDLRPDLPVTLDATADGEWSFRPAAAGDAAARRPTGGH